MADGRSKTASRSSLLTGLGRSFAPNQRLIVAAALLADAAIMLADLALPAEYSTGLFLIGSSLLSFWLKSRRAILGLGALCGIFLVAGYIFSPESPAYGSIETIVNRALTVLVLAWTTVLALAHQSYRATVERNEIHAAGQAARLNAIMATAPDALVIIDQHGTIEAFSHSAEQLFGYSASEAIGQNVQILVPSSAREQHDNHIARYLQTQQASIIGVTRTIEARSKDGRVIPIELSVGEANLDHHPVFVGFIRDMTTRQRIEQELRQAQKMEAIGQLTGGVAHDFNNLLTVIIGNLEMLDARVRGAESRELISETHEAAILGARLIERLLAFGRRQTLNPIVVDVGEVLADFADLLRRALGESIEVTLTRSEEALLVNVDPAQLQNAILNLAINSRDAMPKGGKLLIGVERAHLDSEHHGEAGVGTGPHVVISVSDTGIGMSAEVKERAFEPFFTTKPPGSGTGLGLSTVYGFAKQSKGHARLTSTPGRGTTVQIYLPMVQGDAAERHIQRNSADLRGAGETILVTEDDPRVRRTTVARLKELGYKVIEARSGEKALEIIKKGAKIDLLFTDIVMSDGMTGFDLAQRLRTLAPSIRVLFTSGYAHPDMIARERDAEAAWIRKPYGQDDLARKLHEILGNSQE